MNVYIKAWQEGCKGITVFRDGCSRSSILTIGTNKDSDKDENRQLDSITPIKRGTVDRVGGATYRKSTACVPSMYVTVNKKDGDVFEVFTNTSQGCTSNIGSITRLASLAMRSGVKIDEIVKEMKSNHCQACAVLKHRGMDNISNSCSFAIAEAIEKEYGSKNSDTKGLIECPNCKKITLRPEGKRFTCTSCLYSKCE